MSSKSWTPGQKNAIDTRKGTVLVSAAAGSGKTAVLVQRVIDILTDRSTPVSPNEILVVTFSNAAAAQMRQRIADRLSHLLAEHPQDTYLRTQQMMLASARISTVHSFCYDLIKSNFQVLGISPDVRLGNEKEMKLLEAKVEEETIEAFYEKDEGSFAGLVELISSGRDDRAVANTLHTLYQFLRSHPFYQSWLDEKYQMYDTDMPVAQTVWGKVIWNYADDAAKYACHTIQKALELMEGDEKMEKAYAPSFSSDLTQFEAVRAALREGDWNSVCASLSNYKPQRLGTLRGYEDEEHKALVTGLRKEAQEILKKLHEKLFCSTEEEFREDIAFLKPKIATLFALAKEYDKRFTQEKQRKRWIDFADLEHMAVKLLAQEDGNGGWSKTEVAQELSNRFCYVLVDEYQDTNETQDLIFQCVSKPDNLFMVGDVKQSIYRFRQAMPEIFLQKQESFPLFDGVNYPAKIFLSNNFRSRAEVTDSINYIFSLIMSQDVGELDYTEQESLIPSAVYPVSEGMTTELHLIENQDEENDNALSEAYYVASRIDELLEEHFPVSDGENSRSMEPKDICILLRSPKNRAELYVQALTQKGIPVWCDIQSGYLDSVEISTTLSLLRAVENPLIDIHLTAAMMSAVFRFTPDEMAEIRLYDRSRHLYLNCLDLAADGNKKCQKLTDTIQSLRLAMAAIPSWQLIQQIIEDTGILSFAAAMKYGETRQANLRLLVEYAREYDDCGYKGVSGFLRFLDQMIERGEELDGAPSASLKNNAVRIMSIHKSKGLEFPVVFLSDLSKKFNEQDLRANFLLHSQMGFACVARDLSTRVQYTTVPLEALRLEMERSMMSEELRVLYVAMTRAKEKLIMTSVQNSLARKFSSLNSGVEENGKISPYIVRSARSYADWILMALLCHPDMVPVSTLFGCRGVSTVGVPKCRFDIRYIPYEAQVEETKDEETILHTAPVDQAALRYLKEMAQKKYENENAVKIPSKLTVTQIAEGKRSRQEVFSKEPNFLKEYRMTAAQRGTILHTYLSCANHQAGKQDLEGEIKRMTEERFFTPSEADSLDRNAIRAYYDSDLFSRMEHAAWFRKEFSFMMELGKDDLGELFPELGEECITVQGITDAVFEEDGQIVLVDYKTDHISEEALVEKYQAQLVLYEKIATHLLKKPVKEKILYSMYLKKSIKI